MEDSASIPIPFLSYPVPFFSITSKSGHDEENLHSHRNNLISPILKPNISMKILWLSFQIYMYLCMFCMYTLSYFLLILLFLRCMFESLLQKYFTLSPLFINYVLELLPKFVHICTLELLSPVNLKTLTETFELIPFIMDFMWTGRVPVGSSWVQVLEGPAHILFLGNEIYLAFLTFSVFQRADSNSGFSGKGGNMQKQRKSGQETICSLESRSSFHLKKCIHHYLWVLL